MVMLYSIDRVLVIGLCCLLATACASNSGTRASSTMALLSDADAAYSQGDWERAEALYREVVTKAPPAVEARFRMGVIAFRRGSSNQAEAHFEAVLDQHADHERALYNLAVLHLSEAADYFERYRREAPTAATEEALVRIGNEIERFRQTTSER